MNIFNLIGTIKKLDNLEKDFKRKVIVIGTIEYILTGYKLLFILPTMLLIGLQNCLEWVTDRLDTFCYNLPNVRIAKREDVEKLTNALKKHNKPKVVKADVTNAFEKK